MNPIVNRIVKLVVAYNIVMFWLSVFALLLIEDLPKLFISFILLSAVSVEVVIYRKTSNLILSFGIILLWLLSLYVIVLLGSLKAFTVFILASFVAVLVGIYKLL